MNPLKHLKNGVRKMAIDTTKSWQEFTADGSTAYFAFNFNYVDNSEIRVGIRTAENTYAEIPKEQYQIIKNASTNGGQIRFIQNPSGSEDIDKNPTAGTIVRIERVSPLTSDATWQVGLDMTQMIQLFDSLYRLVQESRGILDNSVQSFKTQHGLTIAELLQKHNDYLLFFDFDSKQFKPTSFTQTQVQKVIDEAVRSAGLTVKNMEWNGNKLSVSFNLGSKNAVVSDNIMQVKAEQNTKGEWIFKYSMDGTTWKAVTETLLHNTLQGRVEADCHPISAITDLQKNLDAKIDKQQGAENSGKILKVGADGNIIVSSEAGGIVAVAHDKTLKGVGTDNDKLGVADGAIGNTQLAQEVKDEIAGKQPKGNYATEEELTQGLATKQPAGDYATNAELAQGLATKQPVGNYATKTELDGKADKTTTLEGYGITDGAKTDLSNLTVSGKEVCANLGMPSDNIIKMEILASGTTYTAPADGYLSFRFYTPATGGFMQIDFSTTSLGYASKNPWGILPLRKGQNFKISYKGREEQSYEFLKFIKAQGVA